MVRYRKLTLEDRLIDAIVYTALFVLSLLSLYPFWNAFVLSLNSGADTSLGGITVWPRVFTVDNYNVVLSDPRFFKALGISVARTVCGTVAAIFFTALLAYGLSRKDTIGRNYYMLAAVFTMYFHGGLIPTYLWLRELGLFNNFWVLFVPWIISVWNMIVFRTFFQGLPDGLEESARIDGCSTYGLFFRIVVPLSGPVIATLSLFQAVFFWNEWFASGIYINEATLLPVQNYLMNMINSNSAQEMISQLSGVPGGVGDMVTRTITPKSLQMTALMVVSLPIIIVYPFVQKFFVKGVMIGSLKE
ncbi:carbohydrate ABC transporter permease [Paenibacillus aurantius]|uniref:Carbohydrate ABC transporter permease n=1 Tax=Paenibacillus aurantius TaxID=2918900 RepID=A0AA96RHP2_9BACL|nr:carbohydrate ABC transporter permease [Paenibacillus aurantius]WNQ13588.1 carbohydrate ABC transporter permease [Paenibacillus aurantius]